jgi:hypothetical protein
MKGTVLVNMTGNLPYGLRCASLLLYLLFSCLGKTFFFKTNQKEFRVRFKLYTSGVQKPIGFLLAQMK